MKKKVLIMLLLLVLTLTGCADKNEGWDIAAQEYEVRDTLDHVSDKTCRVILLYGQSNATGYTQTVCLEQTNPTLCATYDAGFPNVKINFVIEGNENYTDNRFVSLSLSTTNTATSFGPEMGIAERFSEEYQEDDIFIIKYAWGGSSLEREWLTLKNNRNIMYQNAINFTKTCLDYLKVIGYDVEIEGICFMQGEADAFKGTSEKYLDNLKCFVKYIRSDLKKYQKEIRFIDAYIEDIDCWEEYVDINNQKLEFSNLSKLNFVIDTIELGLVTTEEPFNNPDIYHYDSMSMVTLGREFANVMIKDNKK